MTQWVLKENGKVVPHWTLNHLQVSEIYLSTEVKKRNIFTELVKKKWGDSASLSDDEVKDDECFKSVEMKMKMMMKMKMKMKARGKS